MEFLKSYGVVITSIEIDKNGKENPVLTHITWGDSIEQAVAYMKSHLITDFFLSSTLAGEMTLRDNKIILTYNSKVISIKPIAQQKALDTKVTTDILAVVQEIINSQYQLGMADIVNQISKIKH